MAYKKRSGGRRRSSSRRVRSNSTRRSSYSRRAGAGRTQRIVVQVVAGPATGPGGVVADPTGEAMGLVPTSPRKARF